jgi:hypothetical protein
MDWYKIGAPSHPLIKERAPATALQALFIMFQS